MKVKNNKIIGKFNNPNFVHKIMYMLYTVLAVLFMVGMAVASKLYTGKIDLTQNKAFSLSEDSIKFIFSLDKDVEIIVLNTKDRFLANGEYFEQADMVINEYAKYSDKVSVKYVSLDDNPNVKSEYPEDDIREDSIIVKCGEKHRVLSAYDIFNIQHSQMGASIVSSKAEQAMTSAFVYVTSDSEIRVNMITGFDEDGSSGGFVKMLETNNYKVDTLSMLTDNMNDNTVSFIYAPKRDYDDESINKLKNYLVNNENYGRNLIYFINPSQVSLPKIEELVKEWGVKVNDGLVFETDISKRFMNGHMFNTLCEYEETSQYTELIKNKLIPVAMPLSRPLEIVDADKAKTLLKFSKGAGVMPSNAKEDWVPSEQDIKGPIPCMTMSTLGKEGGESKSTLTVVGSVTAVDSKLLSQNSLNNSAYFLNLFNTLTERKDTINIEPKSIGVQELNINPLQAVVIAIMFAIVLPVVVLVTGLVVWLVRRKR